MLLSSSGYRCALYHACVILLHFSSLEFHRLPCPQFLGRSALHFVFVAVFVMNGHRRRHLGTEGWNWRRAAQVQVAC